MRKNTFGEVEVKNYFQIMMMMMMMMMTTMTLLNVTSLVGAKTRSRRKIPFSPRIDRNAGFYYVSGLSVRPSGSGARYLKFCCSFCFETS